MGLNRRRRLHDASALQEVLAVGGVDLVLHGHTHETTLTHIHPSAQSAKSGLAELAGHTTAIPIVGVRSASALSHKPKRMAQYHLYQIEPVSCPGHRTSFHISLVIRGYDKDSGRFQPVGRYNLSPEDSLMNGPIDHSAKKNTPLEAVFSVNSA
jgi:hypothetical protein